MFINKINGISKIGFKGYQHEKNNVGENVMRFNYPYDSDKETCEVQFFRAVPTEKYNYKIVETPIASVQLKPEGVDVNLQRLTDLDKDSAFAYKIVRRDKNTGNIVWEGADTGVKVKNQNGEYVFRNNTDKVNGEFEDAIPNYKYTLVSRKGTTPTVQGAGYLITPDSFMPGAKFRGFNEENTGEIYYDKDYQKKMEGVIKTFSNVYGGSLAGPQKMLPTLKKQGYKILFSTPTANGSEGWCLGYWNKNNMQVSPGMGTKEEFASFYRDLFKNGMKYVFDGTFTSEGLEGIHFQYALRWAEHNPQAYHWFRMSSIKNQNLGLGAVPQNKENLRYRVVNAPFNYNRQADGTYKKEANPDYDKHRETFFQIYDASQVSKEQTEALDKAIKNYENITGGNELDIKTHDDTLINYICQIDPKEYQKRIDIVNELNKKFGKNIDLDSPEGTLMVAQFSNFKIDKKTEGGFVTWDANTDMVKMNYHISGYDEKINQSITNLDKRYQEQKLQERGSYEVQDMTLQAGKYWTGFVKDTQTMYVANLIGKTKSVKDFQKMLQKGDLPAEAGLSEEAFQNILNGEYKLVPKGLLSRDDVTVKSMMRMPLDALEFGENTVGVLSTSYFSNRATSKDTVGVSRFDLMKAKNPHLVEPYAKTYNRVNSLYNNELKEFADHIVNKLNEQVDTHLLDGNNDYSEYGEYVMELVGQDIAKYALFKSLAGDKLQAKVLSNGDITYDYDALKEATTLKALGIEAHNPTDEALMLERKIEKGLKELSDSDVEFVANAIAKKISGTDTMSFRLAEAIVDKAGLGLDWRLDAAKDVMDIDAIRNLDADFDDVWNDLIAFQSKFIQAVKAENPNAYIVAELTDIPDIMADTTGEGSCPYKGLTDIGERFNGEPDATTKLFNETGITSEAGYNYFFTELLKSFSVPFDGSDGVSETHDMFKDKLDLLIQTRSADYLRNLWTFMGNHDKPRLLHGLALDMTLFHNLGNENDKRLHRRDSMQVLSGSKSVEDVPVELRLNVNNPDYFRTVSTRAVAMSKLLGSSINEDLEGIASEKDLEEMNKALQDLANGNYLGEGSTVNYQRINIKELSSLDNAFEAILNIAQEKYSLNLSEEARRQLKDAVVNYAKKEDVLSKYVINGNFDWGEPNKAIGDNNRIMAAKILNTRDELTTYEASNIVNGDSHKFDDYSIYTMSLAMLLRDSYTQTNMNKEAKDAIYSAVADFAKKYNRSAVESNMSELPKIEDTNIGMRKQAYAARDLKLAIGMMIKQAEFNKGQAIENKEAILEKVYKSVTEPAVAKATMIMESLKALPGIQTNYAGDELGMTGYEEKAKNIYLQNRNVLPWSELEENNGIGAYRKTIQETVTDATTKVGNGSDHYALTDGTPYTLDVCNDGMSRGEIVQELNKMYGQMGEIDKKMNSTEVSEAEKAELAVEKENLDNKARELRTQFAKVAYLMQNSRGEMTVSVFNTSGVDHGNRVDYFEKYGLDTEEKRKKFFEENNIQSINPNNKYVPILPKSEMDCILLGAGVALPVGTMFINSSSRDNAKYIVKEVNGKLGIFKEGGKIIMDGLTSKNGVMILKKIAFRGNINKQYHFASNPYASAREVENGKKLSLVAR